jgi:hypothetical protein
LVAALIFAISMGLLSEFFVSYCHSLVAVYSKVELSPQARELLGPDSQVVSGDDFTRLVQLVQLCPDPGDDRLEMRAVRAYYSLLNLLRVARPFAPAVAGWAERERAGCAYFVAVALDRRMACNYDPVT